MQIGVPVDDADAAVVSHIALLTDGLLGWDKGVIPRSAPDLHRSA
jgi:hypothetical protein